MLVPNVIRGNESNVKHTESSTISGVTDRNSRSNEFLNKNGHPGKQFVYSNRSRCKHASKKDFSIPTKNKYKVLADLPDGNLTSINNVNRTTTKSIKRSSKAPSKWHKLCDAEINVWIDNSIYLPKNSVIIKPEIGHLIRKEQDLNLVKQTCDSLQLKCADFVLAVINNRETEDTPEKMDQLSCCHWSLLVFDRLNNTAYHWDSCGGLNLKPATSLAHQFSRYYGGQSEAKVIEMKCRQQVGSKECGIYVLRFLEIISTLLLSNLSIFSNNLFQREFSVDYYYKQLRCLAVTGDGKSAIGRVVPNDNSESNEHTTHVSSKNKSNYNHKYTESGAVHIVADSHGRNIGGLLKEMSNKMLNISAFIKPSAKFGQVLEATKNLKLSSKDTIILMGGANDVYSGDTTEVTQTLKSAILGLKPARVLLGNIPFRRDLPLSHPVNEGIMNLNLHIHEIAQSFDHVRMIDLTAFLDRSYAFDGIHLNITGKKLLASKILKEINLATLQPCKYIVSKTYTNTSRTTSQLQLYNETMSNDHSNGTKEQLSLLSSSVISFDHLPQPSKGNSAPMMPQSSNNNSAPMMLQSSNENKAPISYPVARQPCSPRVSPGHRSFAEVVTQGVTDPVSCDVLRGDVSDNLMSEFSSFKPEDSNYFKSLPYDMSLNWSVMVSKNPG